MKPAASVAVVIAEMRRNSIGPGRNQLLSWVDQLESALAGAKDNTGGAMSEHATLASRADVDGLQEDIARLKAELATAIEVLTNINDEPPVSVLVGIRNLELDLNAEHERAETAEASLVVVQEKALRGLHHEMELERQLATVQAERDEWKHRAGLSKLWDENL